MVLHLAVKKKLSVGDKQTNTYELHLHQSLNGDRLTAYYAQN